MGCDVHVSIEVKLEGRWELLSHVRPDRNYRLFEFVAGVRGEEKNCRFAVRGFPEDASKLARMHYDSYGPDAHTPTHLNAVDIVRLEEWGRATLTPRGHMPWWDLNDYLGCWLFGNSFGGFALYPDERPAGIEDLRMIFWFDN